MRPRERVAYRRTVCVPSLRGTISVCFDLERRAVRKCTASNLRKRCSPCPCTLEKGSPSTPSVYPREEVWCPSALAKRSAVCLSTGRRNGRAVSIGGPSMRERQFHQFTVGMFSRRGEAFHPRVLGKGVVSLDALWTPSM